MRYVAFTVLRLGKREPIHLTRLVDRAQPSCGWCSRNGQLCEYKERKKPGLRAGYGKELEQRIGMASCPGNDGLGCFIDHSR